ncbi:lecithin retinol acyltransferase family protein [Aeromonas schubertii]|uniref:lecithin retinol acyltransferase family protein n=1 Tax=Aeromonas schubertii TaxID=652 RepID=UPI001CC73BCE|nr:lecithin retinol acyltransferase family protein [Aeromonas schubertii]MBZ6071041.1 lecithin retinol acyltransferase family protein [Aeromonas schubertii]
MTRHFIIGDHLVTPQPEGHHHGLFVGHDQVIHCLPFTSGEHSGQLMLTSLTEFSQHCTIEVKPHAQRLFSREESLTRAYARLSEGAQGQPFTNSEQFVTWCIKGLVCPPRLLQTAVATVVAAEVARHTLGKAATSATAGFAASTLATTAGGSGAAATVVSVTGIATAPLLAPLAVGAVAAYGVSKLWDWLND